MKIAIVTDAWLPQINGVVTTYIETIRELGRQGFETVTITPEQFRTVPCPTYPEIALSLVRPATIKNALVDIAPQSIHIATEGPLGWAARRACIAAGFGFTTSYHTRFPEYVRKRFPIPLRFSYSVMRRFHNSGSRMMVSTEPLKHELEQKGFDNVCLWSRGVDTELFKPNGPRRQPARDLIFTYLGRIAPEKNIGAFLELSLPGSKMVIGDGPALDELRARYPDVLFTGVKQGKELADLIGDSSVFVFPSLTDTFGVVLLEAMACGVPVAAYPVNGPRSIIKNGFNGWMDYDLQTAIMKCLDISSDNCRRFALTCSWEKCTKQFIGNLTFYPQPYPFKNQVCDRAAA